MAKEKASVEVSLDGTDAAVSDAKRLDSTLSNMGRSAADSTRKAAGGLLSMAGGALKAASALQGLSIANAIGDAKALDLATAKLGQSAGVSGARLQASFDQAEKKTLASSMAMTEFSRALGRASYDGKFAVGSISALADEALAVGRDLGDELPLGLAMQRLGVTTEALPGELGRVRDMAERLGTVGGPAALRDTLAALSPQLDNVATASDESRAKLEALVAVMGKGLKPGQAQAVASGALDMVKSRALDIERLTGKRVLDDKGQVIDPTAALAEVQRLGRRKFRGNKEAERRAAISEFGPLLGSMIVNTDFSQVDKLASSAKDRGKTAAEAEDYRNTPEGRRQAAELAKQQALRGAGSPILGVFDTLTEKLGPTGSLIATYLGGKGLERAGSALLNGGGGSGGGLAPGAGGGLATGLGTLVTSGLGISAALGVGSLALQGGVLNEIGQDRDSMGQDWRRSHAQTLGSELAQQAIQRGDLSTAVSRAGGDKDVIAAMLTTLEGSLDKLPAAMAQQVAAGIAAELHRAPLKVSVPKNPNEKKGN